ncbi:MAG: di-trans,poly-cis-decaprenylcistransferase [Candidatus Diapherotrites archaeon]|nr:di-trans,poly-cis-decaprenylcistransferase [Candidatus Diapherotrites archaeon]
MLSSLAIIPDGNRRYAFKNGLSFAKAYAAGMDKTREAVEWCADSGVRTATVWTLSTENLQRTRAELGVFLGLVENRFRSLLDSEELVDNGIRLKFVGRLGMLPQGVQDVCARLEEQTRNCSRFVLNMALGYGGQAELVDAIKALQAKALPVTEENLAGCLYVPESPDLIIRTGGTKRLSGFMPWQSAYSELYFSEKLWPEFTKQDFDAAVADYASRERRFGH